MTQLIYTCIILGLSILGLGHEIAKHGEKKDSTYNWWMKLITITITWFLYYKAGLFSVFSSL